MNDFAKQEAERVRDQRRAEVESAIAERKRWRDALDAAKNLDAEESVLGGVLLRPNVMVELVDLGRLDFWDPRNGAVFAAMQDLEAQGKPIDTVTVAAALERREKFEAVGGWARLGELALRVPTPDNVVAYARELRERRIERDLLEACANAPGHVLGGRAHGEEVLDEVLGEIERIERPSLDRELATAATIVARQHDAIERWFADPDSRAVPSIPWRIKTLDEATDGVPIGRVTVVGARTGIGKSTLLVNFLMRTEADEPGIVFSNEDDPDELSIQLLAWEAKVDSRRIRNRNLCGDERDSLARANERIQKRLAHVRFVTNASMSVTEMWRMAAADRRRRGTRWGALDYMQNVPRRGSDERRHEQIDADMQLSQRRALELGMAWMVVSQLNRDSAKEMAGKGKKRRRPQLHDFSDSTAIERCSKLALLLDRDPDGPANVIGVGIAKNKRGVSGPNCWLDCFVNYAHAYIGDLPMQQAIAMTAAPPAADVPHYSEARDREPELPYDDWREQA